MIFSPPNLISLNNDEEMKQNHYFSPTANWVIPGSVMAGQSPARASSVSEMMQSLRVDAGVTTFVCLQSEVLPQSEDGIDFGGTKDGNEVDKMPSYAEAARQIENVTEPKFVYYGIRDEEKAQSLEVLHILIDNLVKRVENGEVLYIHCKGGTGRTGLAVASILGRFYPNLSNEEVLERTYNYCIMRWKGQGKWVSHKVQSPATEGQRQQVRDYLEFVHTVDEQEQDDHDDKCTCNIQ